MGTQFDFTFAPGTDIKQMIGFEMAGELWSQYLNDDVGINIHVEMANILPDHVIGGALPGLKTGVKYKDVKKILSEDDEITSWNDWYAVQSLGRDDEFSASFHGYKTKKLKEMNIYRT